MLTREESSNPSASVGSADTLPAEHSRPREAPVPGAGRYRPHLRVSRGAGDGRRSRSGLASGYGPLGGAASPCLHRRCFLLHGPRSAGDLSAVWRLHALRPLPSGRLQAALVGERAGLRRHHRSAAAARHSGHGRHRDPRHTVHRLSQRSPCRDLRHRSVLRLPVAVVGKLPDQQGPPVVVARAHAGLGQRPLQLFLRTWPDGRVWRNRHSGAALRRHPATGAAKGSSARFRGSWPRCWRRWSMPGDGRFIPHCSTTPTFCTRCTSTSGRRRSGTGAIRSSPSRCATPTTSSSCWSS